MLPNLVAGLFNESLRPLWPPKVRTFNPRPFTDVTSIKFC